LPRRHSFSSSGCRRLANLIPSRETTSRPSSLERSPLVSSRPQDDDDNDDHEALDVTTRLDRIELYICTLYSLSTSLFDGNRTSVDTPSLFLLLLLSLDMGPTGMKTGVHLPHVGGTAVADRIDVSLQGFEFSLLLRRERRSSFWPYTNISWLPRAPTRNRMMENFILRFG
jgi:hypothetical protein